MALFNAFPFTNFHELNMDWLIKKVKEIDSAFPEGLVGISKGGTGADTAAGARENLEIAGDTVPFTSAIPGQSISDYVGDIQTTLANLSDALAENLNYKIYRSVTSLPNITAGTATILGCWYAMSPGEILIAPHTDFAPAEIPSSYGVVFMVRAAATNGMVRYFGNRSYEMALVSNVPDGVWRQLRQNSDIVPIESGGTGANNAEDARANLGIDFSGTVLSVCNQGADSAGNVPLKYTDLVNNYESVVDLGLPASGSTISAIWNLLPVNSRMLFPASQTSDAPTDNDGGYIEIVKTSDGGYIVYRSKTNSPGDARMYLGTGGAPSGTWVPLKNVANLVSYTNDMLTEDYSNIMSDGHMVIINIAGSLPALTRNQNYTIMHFPIEYAPRYGTQCFGALAGNKGAVLGASALDAGIVNVWVGNTDLPLQFYRGSIVYYL